MRVIVFFMMMVCGHAATAQTMIQGVASVIDGDTLEIHGQRVRLYGIDAPESRQECHDANNATWRCGQKSALSLADRMGRASVRCEGKTHDRYRRLVAICFLGSENLNRWMVANGWATAYRQYGQDYVVDEERARNARIGIWSGSFTMPWEWRAERRH